VKKPNRKKTRTRQRTAPPKARADTPQKTRTAHYSWWQISKWAVGTGVAAVSFIAVIADIWGPIWPTDPIFSPGVPSFGSPLSVPFSVENKSIIFPIKNLSLYCGLIFVRTAHNAGVAELSVTVQTEPNELRAPQSRPYTCPFDQKFRLEEGDRITYAQIKFIARYDGPFWGRLTEFVTEPFTLDTSTSPPQWTQGIPLH
jgi:hypothetical protein